MDLVKVLALLHEELDSLNQAIATLEQLRQARPPRLVHRHSSRTTELTGKQLARKEHRHP
jgi:hypothetical protein